MAVAFKGNTIAIIILCVVTIVVFVMYGFDKIKTNDEEPNIPNLAAASKHHIRKKDYVGALTEAVRQIRVDTNLIHQRLEMDYEPWQDFYMMIWNMPEHAWEIIRYKFAVKILKGFLEQQPPSFTMIFTGTSVTAGHESFYSRSYVGIIEERLKKSLTAAGVNLIVRNAAQPAFGCQVNNYCFPSLSIGPGEEIDFFAWENTFNCGAENAPSLEYFSRIAAQHKAIAFYSASGGAPLNNCQPSPDPVPYVSYDWTPEVAGITHTYAPSMAKVSEYKAKMVKRFHLGSAADRLVRLSQRPYKGTAPHGMSMYARTREACNATQVLNPKYVPSTSRAAARRQLAAKDVEPSSITMPMTRKAAPAAANAAAKAASASAASTGAPASAATAKAAKPSNKNATTNAIPPTRSPVATCATNDLWATMCHDQGGPKILTKEFSFKGNAPGVVQGRASYNPSAGSHLLRAELFLYNYNHVLLDAIFNLQKDLSLISAKHHNDPDGMFRHQLDVYERKLAGLQRTLTTPLAEPKHCPAWECGNPMENTQCFTDYQPNYLAAGPATGAAASTAAAATTAVTRDHTLSSLVMGNATKAGWQRVEKNMLSAKQFGNKDRQIYFYTDEFNARLPIALVLPHGKTQLARNAKEADMTGETEGIVKLFAGSDKATLEHAEFYLELDVATTDAELFALQRRVQDRLYAAANKTPVKLIKDVHYVYAKGHVHFFGLPKGYHILFVQSPTEQVSAAVAQRMTAAYAKAYREQQEDSDVSTTAATATAAKKTNKVAGATTTTATATKKKPAAKVVAADGDERRRLAATDGSSVTSAKSLLKPKADANGEEGNKKEEEKKKGPRVVDATTIAKVSVGQMVVF